MTLILHSAWRASAPYRVRIALNLKGLDYDYAPVDLAGGQQHSAAYRALNPQGLTPALEADGHVLTQSLAILEWLEETHPEPALLPKAPLERAAVRTMMGVIACDIHPVNNLRILQALSKAGLDETVRTTWAQRWINDGFAVLEPMIARHGQGFAFGATPTLADCCLIPQVYSSARFKVDLAPYPHIAAVGARAAQHPAFQAAEPHRQPDAVQ